ncbi:50S ribosomal protein L28 [candidate division TA06 bacterium DG_26]|uniref:Large ribosomal subunit protein bL28 n=1 Tax=candidate division TA06 bacterium DG_26 TaxID=1703771 RepID=A0A0S7WJ66_UNCT6|nr:MAG: 50S ribosomal protein L28 [candidate division TA06 bacterium DG_26]
MARKCEICGKTGLFGHQISHAHNVTQRKWQPNLQRVKVEINGEVKRIYVCTRCLRSGAVKKVAK